MKAPLLILIALIFFSCQQESKFESHAMMALAPPPAKFASVTDPVKVERKVIQNGDLTIVAEDVRKTHKEIATICEDLQAYIASENQRNMDNRIQYMQALRVPSSKFSVLLEKIEALGTRTESKFIYSQDVTEEFIDIEARLATMKELEQRYCDLLKRATTVNDILEIENQLATVRADIESKQGRLQYLENQVAYSTLDLTYYQNLGTDFGFASKFVTALSDGWDFLLVVVIRLVGLWPLATLTIALVWYVVKRRRMKSLRTQEV